MDEYEVTAYATFRVKTTVKAKSGSDAIMAAKDEFWSNWKNMHPDPDDINEFVVRKRK